MLLLASLLLAAPACARRGAVPLTRDTRRGIVSLEDPARAQVSGGAVTVPDAPVAEVRPPRYSEEVLPDFPPGLLRAGMEPVTVRVHFTISTDGHAREPRAVVSDGAPEPERFAAACEEVVTRWRFSPAWRLAMEGEEDADGIVPLRSKGYLTFRFEVEGSVEIAFERE